MKKNKRQVNRENISKSTKGYILSFALILMSLIQGHWAGITCGAAAVAAATMFGDKAYYSGAFNEDIKSIMTEKDPRTAVRLLENKLAEYLQWKKENTEYATQYRNVEARLYFQLAKAKEAAGVPKKKLVRAYKKLINFDLFPSDKLYALMWLQENVGHPEYANIVHSVVHDSGYLEQVSLEAVRMIDSHKPERAIDFLGGKFSEYADWRKNNLGDTALKSDKSLAGLYFQLARAKEITGASKDELNTLYKYIIKSSGKLGQKKQVGVLIKLFEDLPEEEQKDIFQTFLQNSPSFEYSVKHLVPIFEEKQNWAAFKFFLDILFEKAKNASALAEKIENNFESNLWKNEFKQYCRSKPKLAGYVFGKDFEIAKGYIANEEFNKAAELYSRILRKCGPEQDKSLIKFKLCQVIFWDGQYDTAASKLEKFIDDFKATHRNLVKQAVLMKGRAYIQLGQINKATDTFLALMMEYPEAQQAAESNFFMGYCYMLQGKFDAAKEAFNLILQDYPGDPYIAKTKVCLRRIKSMTE